MNEINYDGKVYKVIVVTDHLAAISKAVSEGVESYLRGEAVALEFSSLRERGAKTSHKGESSGAASFAELFDKSISPVIAKSHIKPIAMIKESHKDFEEFKNYEPTAIIYLARDEGWANIYVPEARIRPRWELSKEELKKVNQDMQDQANPFHRRK